MKNSIHCLIILSAHLFCGLSVAQAGLPETIIKIKPSVVAVGTVMKTRSPPTLFRGTGFVVGNGNLIVTNAHVIPNKLDTEHNEQLVIFTKGDKSANARLVTAVLAKDNSHDLAILAFDGPALKPLTLGDSDQVMEGELYAFTGFPLGGLLGHFPATHRGIVSTISPIVIPAIRPGDLSVKMVNRLKNPFSIFQLDATAYPGNSGSPLYNPETGTVMGILNMVFVKESKEKAIEKPSGISYAIPVNFVKALLEKSHQDR